MSGKWENQYKIWSDYLYLPRDLQIKFDSTYDHSLLPAWSLSLPAVHSGLAGLHSYHSIKDLSGNLDTYNKSR